MTRFELYALICALILIRDSVCYSDNCTKSDLEPCEIEFLFQEGKFNFTVPISCDKRQHTFENHFDEILNLTLNGCHTYKNVNPFEFIIDPKSVQSLRIERFFIENLNSSCVQKVRHLQTLEFKKNEIVSISDDIFTVFSNIEELAFEENISPSINFTSLQTLKSLKKLTIIQPSWTIQLEDLLRIPEIRSLNLSVNAVFFGPTSPTTDNNMVSLEEIIITNTSLNLNLAQSDPSGMLRNVRTMILSNNRITAFPFHNFNLSNLEKLDLSENVLEFINLNNLTAISPKLKILNISNNEIKNFVINIKDRNIKTLKVIDISHNNLQNFQFLNLVKNLSSSNFQIIVDFNPWSCVFLREIEYHEIFKKLKYNYDFNHMNVNGLNCSHDHSMPLVLGNTIEPWTIQMESSTEISIKTSANKLIDHRENTYRLTKLSLLMILIVSLLIITILCVFSYKITLKKQSYQKNVQTYKFICRDLKVEKYEAIVDISIRK